MNGNTDLVHGEIMSNAVLPTICSRLCRFGGVALKPVVDLPEHHSVARCLHQGLVNEASVRLVAQIRIIIIFLRTHGVMVVISAPIE